MLLASLVNKRNKTRRDIITKFLSKHQLSKEEHDALKGPDIDQKFFDALKSVHQIHNDCKALLRTQHQRAGLEIMELMSEYLESAYKKLYKWVRNEFNHLNKEVPEVHKYLIAALIALKDRPVFLSFCLENVSAVRGKAVVNAFLSAVSGQAEGSSSTKSPISLHAHDPRRFILDMAAFLHQQLAEEIGLVNDLLAGWDKESPEFGKTKRELLNAAMKDTVHPFKVRLFGVLKDNPGIVLLYQLANVLDFYGKRFVEFLGQDADLSVAFFDCKKETMNVFFTALNKQAELMKRAPPVPPSDLSPPHEVHETVNRLTDIIAIFDSSLITPEERETELSVILNVIIDPLQLACSLSSSKLGKIEQSVYMINCLSAIQLALEKYEFVKGKLSLLEESIQVYITQLVDLQASSILQDCGLIAKLSILKYNESLTSKVPLNSQPGMSSGSVKQCSIAFESYLLEFGTLSMPLIERLLSNKYRFEVRQKISTRIIEAYTIFYNTVTDPVNGYDNPESLFRYKPDQVRTILIADV
eukprot:TRINITY_DN9463_c0_g1_i1.p1 TRINITY_DN9463_c0_g1~~TRINITY_DN9463_c0_g1_i1.p1  ORF type:complete len:528 (-),score=77.10 TRINITY_DN9463_c0_g1_i1:11-1594(-)